jgi:hypothetical protein
MLITMAQEALHGYWTQKMRKPQPVPRAFDSIDGLSYLMNSCSLWREDGPLIHEIRVLLEREGQS